jgi:predicted DNA-binding protein
MLLCGFIMKATDLLSRQHKQVRALLRKLTSGRSEVGPVLDEVSDALAAHMAIEQELFYPAVREVDDEMVLESFEEHALAEIALKRLRATEPGSEAFRPRATALQELIEHHVEEEEETLLPEVEKKLDEEQLVELGLQMKERYDEVLQLGFENAVPKSPSQTSADKGRAHLETGNGSALQHRPAGQRRQAH